MTMIKPSSMTYHCPQCNWSQTVSPKSDVLMPSNYFDACPKCGNETIERHRATTWEATKTKIAQLFGNFSISRGMVCNY